MAQVRAAAASWGYRAAFAAVPRMPKAAVARLFDQAADAATARRGPSVVQLARNLRRVLGATADPSSLHAVVTAAMRSYGRYWLETFRLESRDLATVAEQALAGSVGLEHVQAAQDAGRGVILALPHSGNWDIAGLSMAQSFGGIVTVAERLKPESLFRRFVRYRENLGFEVLPLTTATGTPGTSATVLRERLMQGRVLCLLADRDIGGHGVPVTFFGESSTMPAGPAMLAARTDAALIPVHLAYTDTGVIQYFAPPLDLPGTRLTDQVHAGTQALADFFAERIALFPADWHMLQPLWSADRARPREATR